MKWTKLEVSGNMLAPVAMKFILAADEIVRFVRGIFDVVSEKGKVQGRNYKLSAVHVYRFSSHKYSVSKKKYANGKVESAMPGRLTTFPGQILFVHLQELFLALPRKKTTSLT